jgi:hypothetical protein
MGYRCNVVVEREVPVLYLSQENTSSPLKKYILVLKIMLILFGFLNGFSYI